MADNPRDKAIDLAVSSIEKQFGKGSIMRLGDEQPAPEVKVISSGSLGLDIALGKNMTHGYAVDLFGVPPRWVDRLPCRHVIPVPRLLTADCVHSRDRRRRESRP